MENSIPALSILVIDGNIDTILSDVYLALEPVKAITVNPNKSIQQSFTLIYSLRYRN
jgi:hypothetical protein